MGQVINLDAERPCRLLCDAPEALDPDVSIAAAQRAWLAVEDALAPWSDSALIAALVTASPREREEIIAELEARAQK